MAERSADSGAWARALPDPRAARLRTTGDLDAAALAGVRALLDAAFDDGFSDDDWAHALGGFHATIDVDGAIVAHASVVPRTLAAGDQVVRAGYVEAVAVHPRHQRTGLGTAVMRVIGDVILRHFEIGALSTGEWHFYERLGWERWRGETWVRHADGQRERSPDDDDSLMILRTPTTPAIDLGAPLTCETRSGDAW